MAPALTSASLAALRSFGRAVFHFYIESLRAAEWLCGPRILPWVVAPNVCFQVLSRAPDFRQFKKLRAALPSTLRSRLSSPRHFYLMFRNWTGCLVTTLFYDRLNLPRWREQIAVRGAPPHLLPGFQTGPVVVAFLHTGGFPILRHWLRAQGIPAVTFLNDFPSIYWRSQYIRDRADPAYGLANVPHTFSRASSLLAATRFLQPGRAVVMALEERDFSQPRESYEVNGGRICLSPAAFRLTAMTGATLLPATVRQFGLCRFEIRFGEPVPAALLEKGDLKASYLHLLQELWKDVGKDPSGLTWTAMEALAPDAIGPRGSWP